MFSSRRSEPVAKMSAPQPAPTGRAEQQLVEALETLIRSKLSAKTSHRWRARQCPRTPRRACEVRQLEPDLALQALSARKPAKRQSTSVGCRMISAKWPSRRSRSRAPWKKWPHRSPSCLPSPQPAPRRPRMRATPCAAASTTARAAVEAMTNIQVPVEQDRRAGRGAAERRRSDRRNGHLDRLDRAPDQPAGSQRHHRSGPRR